MVKRCVAANPKHNEEWQPVLKAVENSHQPTEALLKKVVVSLDKDIFSFFRIQAMLQKINLFINGLYCFICFIFNNYLAHVAPLWPGFAQFRSFYFLHEFYISSVISTMKLSVFINSFYFCL